jgi:uncharacterized protein YecT (DUF1311 family)
MKCLVLALITFFQIGYCSAQTIKTVDSLEDAEQACLDKGVGMPDCAFRFYDQMDSLLNVVYRKLYAGYSPAQQSSLKSQQRLWLKKRDEYFRKVAKEKEELQGGDAAMIKADKRAQFVKNRVIVLIRMANSARK